MRSSASSTLSGLCGKKFFHENNLKWRPADYLLLKHDADIEHHIITSQITRQRGVECVAGLAISGIDETAILLACVDTTDRESDGRFKLRPLL